MKTRDGIAVSDCAISTALGPADNRKEAHALRMKPGAFFAGGEGYIGFRPKARPIVFRPVEAGRAEPILQRKLMGIADAQPTLFW